MLPGPWMPVLGHRGKRQSGDGCCRSYSRRWRQKPHHKTADRRRHRTLRKREAAAIVEESYAN